MSSLFAVLAVHGPDGKSIAVDLVKDRISIRWVQEFNDVSLEPDPQQLITRKAHCILERDADCWWVLDNGSVNRAFGRREHGIEVVNGRAPLRDGDAVRGFGYWSVIRPMVS